MNLSDSRYYFELANSPNLIWLDLAALNLKPGAAVRGLDPDEIALVGNVTGALGVTDAPF